MYYRGQPKRGRVSTIWKYIEIYIDPCIFGRDSRDRAAEMYTYKSVVQHHVWSVRREKCSVSVDLRETLNHWGVHMGMGIRHRAERRGNRFLKLRFVVDYR